MAVSERTDRRDQCLEHRALRRLDPDPVQQPELALHLLQVLFATRVQVAPSSISLYASQSEQFTVPGTCDATITWSLPAGSLGTLTSAGLYMAPSAVSSQQTVTVSATSQSNGSSLGSAQVTLTASAAAAHTCCVQPVALPGRSTQSFTATLLDPQGNPHIGVTVNFTVAGVNEGAGSATTGSGGII